MPSKACLWNVDSGNHVGFNLLSNINLLWTFYFFWKAEITLKMQLYCVAVVLWCIIVPYQMHMFCDPAVSPSILYLRLSHTHGHSEQRPVRLYWVQKRACLVTVGGGQGTWRVSAHASNIQTALQGGSHTIRAMVKVFLKDTIRLWLLKISLWLTPANWKEFIHSRRSRPSWNRANFWENWTEAELMKVHV